MPSGETTTSSMSEALQSIVDSARMEYEYGTVMSRVVDRQQLESNTGMSWEELLIAKLTASDVDENTLLDNFQELSTSSLSITPIMSGISTFVTVRAEQKLSKKVLGKQGTLMSAGLNRKEDIDGIALLDTFSNSQPGIGGTLSRGVIAAAVRSNAVGDLAEPWDGPQVAVLHSWQVYDLDIEATGGLGTYPIPNGLTEQIYKNGFAGMCGGAEIFVDDNITIDSANDAKGAVFARGDRGAIVLVRSAAFERAYERFNPAFGGGGMERYLYRDYAFGKRLDGWGTEIYSDATEPAN